MKVRSSLRALGALVVLPVLLTTMASGASAATSTGFDISYPQCNGSFPTGGSYGIVGVNGGRVLLVNPCLGTGDGPTQTS